MLKTFQMLLVIAALVTSLSGCGKKPGMLDAPQGLENDRFPQAYPNPATDPKPKGK
jgi:predicted small lipoprotein YifL